VPAESPRQPLDFNWLDNGLALGSARAVPAGAAERLARDHAITHIVDLRAENQDDRNELARAGIRLLWLPTIDRCALTRPMIRTGVDWVARAFERGGRVLVHCQHGIGRSALLALCVLVEQGSDPIAALTLVKAAREIVSPSPEQLTAFIGFVQSTRQARGASWSVPSLDDLSRIAYRHLAAGAEGEAHADDLGTR
jgi:protein-tyrosine phosphatase